MILDFWTFSTSNINVLRPVSTVTNVENNEIRIEKKKTNGSGYIPLTLLSIPFMFVSHYSDLHYFLCH